MDFASDPPGAWLFPLAVAAALAGTQEVASLLASGGQHPRKLLLYLGTLLVIGSNAVPLFVWKPPAEYALAALGWPMGAFTFVVLSALVCEVYCYERPGKSIVSLGLSLFGVAYLGLLLSFALELRGLGGPAEGMVALLSMIAVVKSGDTGAYTVGRLVGRHKMSPLVSPGKTWEGAAGAILFATLAAWLCFTYLPPALGITDPLPAWYWLVFGPVVGLAGLMGDLSESLLKRDMGRKDSSTWLPGFGGVLDVIDAVLFAAPVAYLCWLAGRWLAAP
jgi:phosphatidate cytidylyltransferase